MDKAIKAVWVEALRSGRYKQGVYRLRGSKGFCCLGVLCDLGEQKAWVESSGGWGYQAGEAVSYYELPERIQARVGLSGEEVCTLGQMNDGGVSFEQIADWIEENL